MALPRSAGALRTFARSARVGTPGIRASSRAGWCARRGYATEGAGHEAPKPGGDLTWFIGSVVFTAPAMYYLWPSPSEGDHGHGHEHAEEKHEEAKQEIEQPTPAKVEAKAEQAAVKNEPPSDAEPAEEQKEEEKTEDKEETSEKEDKSEQQDTDSEAGKKTDSE